VLSGKPNKKGGPGEKVGKEEGRVKMWKGKVSGFSNRTKKKKLDD